VSSLELPSVVYHGAPVRVTKPNPLLGADRKDFGRGFYTTPNLERAKKFARLKAKREGGPRGWVSSFRLMDVDDLAVKTFSVADHAWFDFVLAHRGFPELADSVVTESVDVIVGPVANDAVGLVLNQFVNGTFGNRRSAPAKDIAISLLLTQRLHQQVFFATVRACQQLEWIESTGV